MTKESVTPRSLVVLRVIAQFHLQSGRKWMPSVDEICERVGFASKSTAQEHVRRLERIGCIERKRPESEQYRITDLGWNVLDVTEMAA